ncbi:MAG: SRPBCC family protein [Bacteroidetes bacterium]|nr:SRPBCC family protein [Bacteroidota bacterium]
METTANTIITVEATINASVEKAWDVFTNTKHITHWNHASDDWHSPSAENDLRPGGKFVYRMEAKDGSFGFDFGGTYEEVKPNEKLVYTIGDGRKVENVFTKEGGATRVTVTFEAENQNSIEMQRGGWQAILDNFKKYAESAA